MLLPERGDILLICLGSIAPAGIYRIPGHIGMDRKTDCREALLQCRQYDLLRRICAVAPGRMGMQVLQHCYHPIFCRNAHNYIPRISICLLLRAVFSNRPADKSRHFPATATDVFYWDEINTCSRSPVLIEYRRSLTQWVNAGGRSFLLQASEELQKG